MRLRLSVIVSALLATSVASAQPAATQPSTGRILIAGDSTAQAYGPERYPQQGWGQFLACGLVQGSEVINRAKAARSTRTFIGEQRWDDLMNELRPGDTVLIQFGHNDAARDKPERYADPATTFRDNLLRFVWETRGRRAVPILMTPVARRNFGPDGKARADFPEWSAITRTVAAQTATPLIDHEALSRALLDREGKAESASLYLHLNAGAAAGFPKGIEDDTHFSELGARQMADLVAGALAALPVPAAQLVVKQRPDLVRKVPLGSSLCH